MRTNTGHELECLLDYELKQSTRHRRFVSLVLLSANGSSKKFDNIIEDVVRSTDPFFFLNDTVTVLMGETDSEGARKAIERYRQVVSHAVAVKSAVASFPQDGMAVRELMEVAHRRLDIANISDSKPVFTNG
jgi:hypothetical protein